MRVIEVDRGVARVELTRHEIALLSNAINETIEALDDVDFHTRTGCTPEEFRSFQAELRAVYEEL